VSHVADAQILTGPPHIERYRDAKVALNAQQEKLLLAPKGHACKEATNFLRANKIEFVFLPFVSSGLITGIFSDQQN